MSRDQQRLQDYLAHIIQAIQRIHHYTEDMDEVGFLENELVQDAVIRNIEIIGEASNNIDKYYQDFAKLHPELPLIFAYEMRNAVAHGYFKVDLEIVWKTIKNDLPVLEQQTKDVLQQLIHHPDTAFKP
ncbi:MAG: hypothetical protein CTY38_00705 [Methylotenera sp.]|jgi:uncharacterized protein with HEPN domain|uniref:HepT-like ribonuclease domain-containing protein n=1 Tax=Methylotenera sp. TaxID=2051956 RepID=UPI000D3F765C|nr:DUF86 domain-containing protein [Methylotenera sp.]MDZ4141876.1 DUF86 domain-containing protein [Methylotenera sp.]PPC84599.1 MAG: hypothetical protein CTY38_00705 [Methylotenera sp.]